MPKIRIALVTGANRGLGLETSRQLARLGIKVLMGSRSARKGKAAVQELADEGLDVEFILLDVTKSDHIIHAAEQIRESFGKLDILVNNAGIAHRQEASSSNSAETASPRALRETFDVNFFGLVELTQALLPLLKKSGGGRVVNVSSIVGSLTNQSGDGGISYKPFSYGASKTAVNVFTVYLASALKGSPIKINSAHPGWVKTDMGGKEAPMTVEEGAKTAVRLATLGADGPSGKFFHLGEEIPW
ncbi:MAG TPA: SDR family oxidoreductase [Thermodesulfovibrionales bacterium]|nr:SDR family oxidoreductase [Thermodesulfovibrionales bacterium]